MHGDGGYPGSEALVVAEPEHHELAEFGEGVSSQQTPPFCPTPSRVEPIPRIAFRQPALNDNHGPAVYRTVKTVEYKQAGAQSYEIILDEFCTFGFDAGAQAVGAQGLFPREGPGGVLRLRVTSGNLDVGRLHDGRSTLVVTGSEVRVEVLIPVDAVTIDTNPLPAAGPADSNAITFVTPRIRMNALPARSRRPSEWRICDFISQIGLGPFTPNQLAPGSTEIQATGVVGPTGTNIANLTLTTSPFGPAPTIAIGALFNDAFWTPTGCASHWVMTGTDEVIVETFMVHQRGWI